LFLTAVFFQPKVRKKVADRTHKDRTVVLRSAAHFAQTRCKDRNIHGFSEAIAGNRPPRLQGKVCSFCYSYHLPFLSLTTLKISIPNPPQHLYPQSPPHKMYIASAPQSIYPPFPSKPLSRIPLKISIPSPPQTGYPQSSFNMSIPKSLTVCISKLPQNIYPQSPSKCLYPIPLKMTIPNLPQNLYPQCP
jgi:hypothetical protein